MIGHNHKKTYLVPLYVLRVLLGGILIILTFEQIRWSVLFIQKKRSLHVARG